VNRKSQLFILNILVVGVMLTAACSKKVAKASPPPPPPPAAPTATLAVSPDVIRQGESTQLTWQTSNADSISIESVGDVSASGSRSVNPSESTTYTLIAKGPGGTQQATARVTVNPAPTPGTPAMTEEELFEKNMKDVFFDYDKADLRSDQKGSAHGDAAFLAQHPNMNVLIAGHCDDRGSEEYNLALGDSRANNIKNALVAEGVSADRIKTVSFGKEKPFCSEDNEQCWQQNRRDHFSMQP
jgi:peptidoglycan-associated lipoprotein